MKQIKQLFLESESQPLILLICRKLTRFQENKGGWHNCFLLKYFHFKVVWMNSLFWSFLLDYWQKSSHRRCSVKKAVHYQHRCFHVNITKFLRTPILKNIRGWLLLLTQLSAVYLAPYQSFKYARVGIDWMSRFLSHHTTQKRLFACHICCYFLFSEATIQRYFWDLLFS